MNLVDINWGEDSAEKDPRLLDYFIDAQALTRIRKKAKSIVVGRKGAGKSALRTKASGEFAKEANTYVVNIVPTYAIIRSIINSEELAKDFGTELFFQHTWIRKILLDCLAVAGEDAKSTFARGSFEFARGVAREVRKSSKDIAENIAEILTSIKAKAGKLGEFGLALEKELRAAAEADALEHHMSEIAKTGKQFIVLIDDLDQGWDNSELANNLLLGLLSASAYISAKIPNLYCCVFLREDVYSILVSKTQHADKYRNIERIRWDKNGLISILNERIAYNRRVHAAEPVIDLFHSVFPEMVGTTYADNWLIERTLSRPRELIQLARNYTESVGGDMPSDTALKNSEVVYSSWKLQDVCSEYSNQYPNLLTLFNTWKAIFNRHKYSYRKAEIVDKLETLLLEVTINETWLNQIMSHKQPEIELLLVLYEIGVVGDYVAGGSGGGAKVYYSFADTHEPRFDEVHFHPCFRKALNMVERIRN